MLYLRRQSELIKSLLYMGSVVVGCGGRWNPSKAMFEENVVEFTGRSIKSSA